MKGDIFKQIQLPKVDTSGFDMSHDVKLSFKMGCVTPTTCMDILPGDMWKMQTENMLRFAPLISPVMHKVKVKSHYYFVPNRILWDNWEKFIVQEGSELGGQIPPYVMLDRVVQGSICDYLGIPVGEFLTPIQVNALPILAYLRIWNEYYRDQNLQDKVPDEGADGDMTAILEWTAIDPMCLPKAWEHDYFTSCLPFAQKGDTVQIPIATSTSNVILDRTRGNQKYVFDATGLPVTPGESVYASNDGTGTLEAVDGSLQPASVDIDPNGSLYVDIQSGATDINTLRRAFRLQEWLERNARAGTRYIENILAHFGVKSSDARLQRPEYIGGSAQNMVISEVLSTTQNDDATQPLGTMGGHGISVGGSPTFSFRAEEHGWVIGVMCVIPETAYFQGLHRSFSRQSALDYAWPSFANIGEQEVLQKELLANSLNPEATFGYIPRYAEYKYLNSRVAGEMRSSLEYWHMARKFEEGTDVPLNGEFIASDPTTRIFAVIDGADHIYAHIFNNFYAVRKLPKYGIPTI